MGGDDTGGAAGASGVGGQQSNAMYFFVFVFLFV